MANQDTTTNYGPFTDALLGPLSGQQQKASQSFGYGGTAATLAQFANSFIRGAQEGQRTKYEQSEAKKQQAEKNFDQVMAHIQADPTLSQEGKQAAQQQYLKAKYGQVNEHLKGAKDQKDNPMMNMVRAISGAVVGPGENKAHKEIDVNSLLAIATDPKYKIDPNKIAGDAAAGISAELNKMQSGVQPGVDNANLPPGSGSGAAQVPGLALPAGPTLPPQEISAGSVARNPEIQKHIQSMTKEGINPYEHPATGGILKSVPAEPKAVAPKTVGVYVYPQGWKQGDPLPAQIPGYQDSFGAFRDPVTHAVIPGAVPVTSAGVAGSKLPNAPSLQHQWIKREGSESPEVAYINPKNPKGYVDVRGNPIEGNVQTVPAPTEGSGQARTFELMAQAEFARQGIKNPTRDQLRQRAGEIAEIVVGSPIARRQQEMAMDQQLSGIGPGPGLGGGGRTPPPGVSQKTAPQAGAPTAQSATPAAPPATKAAPKAATKAPPAAATSGAKKDGEERAAASTISKSEEDDADYYMGTVLGTQKGTGKGSQIKAQRGEKIIREKTGLNPMALQAEIADYQATKKALTQAEEVSGAFARVQETLKEHGKVLLDAAKAQGPGDIPLKNRTLQWVQENTGAHPELTRYLVAINAIQREYGRLTAGGAQSRAMLPVSASNKGETVIRRDLPMSDILAAVDQLNIEASTEQKAFSNQANGLKQKMVQNPIGRAFRPSAGESKTSITTKSGHTVSIGDTVILKDGTQHKVKGFSPDGGIIRE